MTKRIAPANAHGAAKHVSGSTTSLPARLMPMPVADAVDSLSARPGRMVATATEPDYRMVMVLDLSEPIDTLAINVIRRCAQSLEVPLTMVCIDDRPDASEHRAAWLIRDLLRYCRVRTAWVISVTMITIPVMDRSDA